MWRTALLMGDEDDEDEQCPLCMQPLDETDISFFPCPCNYQVHCYYLLRVARDIDIERSASSASTTSWSR